MLGLPVTSGLYGGDTRAGKVAQLNVDTVRTRAIHLYLLGGRHSSRQGTGQPHAQRRVVLVNAVLEGRARHQCDRQREQRALLAAPVRG